MDYKQLTTVWPKLEALQKHPIAYFCAEFALSDELPIYSGGLGVLAGDVVREAESAGIPLLGIGLLYKEGYFTQKISEDGIQDELPAYLHLETLPISQVTDSEGKELLMKLYIADRIILVRTWKYMQGSIPVYLLDTDVEGNQELDRRITLTLYPKDNEWRIQQEIILGIGGARLLDRLGITPSVHHLNEGHSAFAILEIAHQHMKRANVSFKEAFTYACSHTVFTNHTLIPSGNDIFDREMVRRLLNQYADHLGLPIDEIVTMGSIPGQEHSFSMTHLALSASKKISAVSKTHAEFAKVTWPDSHLTPITNGVHQPYWQADSFKVITEKLRRGFDVPDSEIWYAQQKYKAELMEFIANTTGTALNPEALTVTWARRIASYKQPLLLFSDIERLKQILSMPGKPAQIIIAGKAHPGDITAKGMISEAFRIIRQHGLEKHIVFVPNYNLKVAKLLVHGSDVWLSTPIKGQEACGTSGMKAALNGCLQFTISDGWTDEIPLQEFGFAINPVDSASSLYAMFEQRILPMYHERNSDGMPEEWLRRVKDSITFVATQFTTDRMMREYMEQLYLPIV